VLSNNPRKYYALAAYGLEVVEHLPLLTPPTRHNARYLRTKREKLGHLLDAALLAGELEPGPSADVPGSRR
jgi:3,4-dihydroxy 2-butanone 4-phosphate synthase/GTP cyclohydrolase II